MIENLHIMDKEARYRCMLIKKIEEHCDVKPYGFSQEQSDMLLESQIPIMYHDEMSDTKGKFRVLSLFSGCGGMDLLAFCNFGYILYFIFCLS